MSEKTIAVLDVGPGLGIHTKNRMRRRSSIKVYDEQTIS